MKKRLGLLGAGILGFAFTLSASGKVPEGWQDVTTTGDGITPSTCQQSWVHCSFKDLKSGGEFSKPALNIMEWQKAIDYCVGLTINGKSDWRLPTFGELMRANRHGIWRLSFQLRFPTAYYWSATEDSTNYAYFAQLWFGPTNYRSSKYDSYGVVCVRP